MSTKLPDVFICFLLTVGVVLSYGPPSWQLDHDLLVYEGGREKRASYPLNPFRFSKGLNALNQLLFKARRVWTPSRKFRKYEKNGDVNDAINDFYSIKPENIEFTKSKFQLDHIETEGLVYKGTVGDREVRLLHQGDGYSHGRPVLDVIESRKSTFRNSNNQPYIDRFIYKDKPTQEILKPSCCVPRKLTIHTNMWCGTKEAHCSVAPVYSYNYWPFQCGISVVVHCVLFALVSVFVTLHLM